MNLFMSHCKECDAWFLEWRCPECGKLAVSALAIQLVLAVAIVVALKVLLSSGF